MASNTSLFTGRPSDVAGASRRIFCVASGRLCDSKKMLPRAVRTWGMLLWPLPWPKPIRANLLFENPALSSSLSTILMVLSSSRTTSAWQASSSTTRTMSMLDGRRGALLSLPRVR